MVDATGGKTAIKLALEQGMVERAELGHPEAIDGAFEAGDVEKAIALVEAAGRAFSAGRLDMPLERIEGWLDRLGPLVQDRPWLLYSQYVVCGRQQRRALAAAAIARAAQLFSAQPEGPERTRALSLVKLGQGVLAAEMGHLALAREAFSAARELLGGPAELEPWIDPADAVRWRSLDPSGATAFYLDAIPVLRRAGETVLLGRCLRNFSAELQRRGELVIARRAAQQAVELKRVSDTDEQLAWSLNTLGLTELELGLHERARVTFSEAIERAGAGGNPMCRAYATANLAEVERDAGRFDVAEQLYAKAVAEVEALNDERGIVLVLRAWSALKRRRGDATGARQLLERARQLGEPIANPIDAARFRLEEGLVALALGETTTARAILDTTRALAETVDAKLTVYLAGLALAAIDQDPDSARAVLANVRRYRLDAVVGPELELLERLFPGLRPARAGAEGPLARPTVSARASVVGEFRLELAGRRVDLETWRSKRAGELLRILIAHRHRWVEREELIEWLWAGVTDATRRLNTTVNLARRGLEQVAGVGWILREGSRYRFARLDWVDADELVDRYEAARSALSLKHLDRAREELRRARALLRGDPYADDRYADWAAPERTRLAELSQRVREGLAAVGLERGDYEDAILAAEEAIAAEPSRESAHQLLIRAHLAGGDRASALRALGACREALRRELGLAPSAQTMMLCGMSA